jgi:hypothetical protein
LHDGTLYQASNFSPVSCIFRIRNRLINIGVKGEIHCMDYDVHHRHLAIGLGDNVYIVKEGGPQGFAFL